MNVDQWIQDSQAIVRQIDKENRSHLGSHTMKGKLDTAETNIRCAVAMLQDFKQQSK